MNSEYKQEADGRESPPMRDKDGNIVVSDEQTLAREVVNELVSRGIKVLALDFDRTIVSVHTAGYWRQDTSKLAEYVRPCFRELIREALLSSLFICVVTYSRQPILIRDVLKMVLPKSDINRILIRANSKDWLPAQGLAMQRLGKQQHIAWIVTELFNRKHAIIHSAEILLMDDDSENIEVALEFGHQAYEVPDDVSLQGMLTYAKTVEVKIDPAMDMMEQEVVESPR